MADRIKALKERMQQNNTDYYIVTTTDAHNSEYVSEHDMVLEFITGFSGSNGTLLVTPDEALLWTDGRYYIQCENEIVGTGIKMMREGDDRDPSVQKYLDEHVKSGESIGFNGNNVTAHRADMWVKSLADREYRLITDMDLAGDLWNEEGDRPAPINGRIYGHDIKYAGEDVASKLSRACDKIRTSGGHHLFISKPDDIMWLFNIRGEDIAFNPVALSYAFITVSGADNAYLAYLFINSDRMEDNAKQILSDCKVDIRAYNEVFDFLKEYDYIGNVSADEREMSVNAKAAILAGIDKADNADTKHIVSCVSPVTELKAVKNETEIANMKKYFLADSYATASYLYTVKKIMGCDIKPEYEPFVNPEIADKYDIKKAGDFDELKAAEICDEIRCATAECEGLSFTTIAAYAANAAMMHYEATDASYAKCEASGMLLTDCGGQYPGATTDVTRTIALGPVTDVEKRDFTLVLKGWLALMHATWLYGCTGRNLDILARQYLWNEGMDYKCGTGHGVGYNLSVHEGPQNIRWRYIEGSFEAILKPGMVVTNEPGVYKGGRYGIRTENTMLVVEKFVSDGERYLGFENLTWVPIDEDLIDYSLLDDKESKWLSEYQSEALSRIKNI